MTDITERLRSLQTGKTLWTVAEAANEIDRLREDVRTGEAWINTLVAKNVAAAIERVVSKGAPMSELRERIERAIHNVEYTAGEAAASLSSVAETLHEALALLTDAEPVEPRPCEMCGYKHSPWKP